MAKKKAKRRSAKRKVGRTLKKLGRAKTGHASISWSIGVGGGKTRKAKRK